MSKCRFERTLRNLEDSLRRAKEQARKHGSTFEGDLEKGHFSLKTPLGTVEGTYSATGSNVLFLIESKPMLLPCAVIEEALDRSLSKA